MKKIIIPIVIAILFFSNSLFAQIEPIKPPQIIIWPESYVAGEETFYLEGIALPEAEIIISLEKEKRELKRWQTLSNEKGEWFFSTKELIGSGTYYLSVKAKDKKGMVSDISDSYPVEISLSGLSLGPLMLTFKILVSILGIFLGLIVVLGGYFIGSAQRTKKILKKETREAKESLRNNFATLKKEIEKRIELLDFQPGFNPAERKVCDDLKEFLKTAEESVNKEIKDIEKELE